MSCGDDFFSTTVGVVTLLSLFVILFARIYPFSKALLTVSSKENIPFAEPTVVSFCLELIGTNASISFLKNDLLPDCDAKWIVGVQKPETQIQSH